MPTLLRNAAIGVAVLAVAAVSTFTAVNANAATSPPQITPVTAQQAAAPAGAFALATADDSDGPCQVYTSGPGFNDWGNIASVAFVRCPFQMQRLRVTIDLAVNGYYVYGSLNSTEVIASYSVDNVLSAPVSCWMTGAWVANISVTVTEPGGNTLEDWYQTPPHSILCGP